MVVVYSCCTMIQHVPCFLSHNVVLSRWSQSVVLSLSVFVVVERQSVRGVVESLKIVTRTNSERIARFAFDYAVKHGREKVTSVHKANIMWVLLSHCCSYSVTIVIIIFTAIAILALRYYRLTLRPVSESGQVPLSNPLSGVLRPKFGLRPDLSQNLTWRWRFGLRIFLDRIWVLARC